MRSHESMCHFVLYGTSATTGSLIDDNYGLQCENNISDSLLFIDCLMTFYFTNRSHSIHNFQLNNSRTKHPDRGETQSDFRHLYLMVINKTRRRTGSGIMLLKRRSTLDLNDGGYRLYSRA